MTPLETRVLTGAALRAALLGLAWRNSLCVAILVALAFLLTTPQPASARSLLCTNSEALTENSIPSVAEYLSKDSAVLTVFDPEQDMPEQEFQNVFIIELLDRPEISSACGEYAGIDAELLALQVQKTAARIGEEVIPVPGLPGGKLDAVGTGFANGEQSVFLQVTIDSGVVGLLSAIAIALEGRQTNCLTDPDCLALIESW